MHHREQNQDEKLRAPEGLTAALRRLPEHTPFIPPTVDEAVLRAARRHLQPERRAWLFRWRLGPWAAAAAALCVLGLVSYQLNRPKPGSAPRQEFAARDVNQDDRLDILDAFALARHLKAGDAGAVPGLDVNGDGAVDELDVMALAARVVRLEKGGRS